MIRRKFLRNCAAFLAGTLVGCNGIQRAVAAGTGGCFEPRAVRNPKQAQIALIIDDIGFSRFRARQFLSIGIPITFAVLPRLGPSREMALEIHENGHEVMLHQPMEPFNSRLNPGPGALYVGNRPERITAVVQENIAEIPNISGVNNHMGSRFTASAPDIQSALNAIKNSDLFFIDSLTSGRSVALKTARRLDMTTAGRNVFLDTVPEADAVYGQLLKLKRHADRFGQALGIGHPFTGTVRGIRRFVENPAHSGVAMVHVSRILPRTPPPS